MTDLVAGGAELRCMPSMRIPSQESGRDRGLSTGDIELGVLGGESGKGTAYRPRGF